MHSTGALTILHLRFQFRATIVDLMQAAVAHRLSNLPESHNQRHDSVHWHSIAERIAGYFSNVGG